MSVFVVVHNLEVLLFALIKFLPTYDDLRVVKALLELEAGETTLLGQCCLEIRYGVGVRVSRNFVRLKVLHFESSLDKLRGRLKVSWALS